MLARHLPAGVALGRPLAALRSPSGEVQVITSLCVWFVSAAEASRLLPISGDRVELTTFEHRRETARMGSLGGNSPGQLVRAMLTKVLPFQ